MDREELFHRIDDRLERTAREQRELLQQIGDRLERTAGEQRELLERTAGEQRELLERISGEQRELLQQIEGHLGRMGGERGFFDQLFGDNKKLDDWVQEMVRDQRELLGKVVEMNQNLERLVGDAPSWFAGPREFESVREKLDKLTDDQRELLREIVVVLDGIRDELRD